MSILRLIGWPWFSKRPVMDTGWERHSFYNPRKTRLRILASRHAELHEAYLKALRQKQAVKPILAELQRVQNERLRLEQEGK